MRLLDRYIVRSFLINYLLAFCVMVGLYTVLDLIVNFDKFTKGTGADVSGWSLFIGLSGDILDYYFYQLLVIFQLVSAAIPLLAAGFTMVRMTRHQELTAMLASGVSLYRVATPIILCAVFFSLLVVVDQEFLMPASVDKLLRRQDEVGRNATISRTDPLYFVRDIDNSLLMASRYDPKARELTDVRIIQRSEDGTVTGRIMARKATWTQPTPANKLIRAEWYLEDIRIIDDASFGDPLNRLAEPRKDQYYSSALTPEQLDLVFSKKAVEFLSSGQIQTLISTNPVKMTQDGLIKIMHVRFSQPIMNLILLLIGIPFLLTREPRRLIMNMIYCTMISAVCFVATFVMFQMAGTVVPPVLGAWMPVLVFGPLAAAMLDTIKT